MSRLRAGLGLVAWSVGLLACSLVNRFDDLRLEPDATASSAGGFAGGGGQGGAGADPIASSSSSTSASATSTGPGGSKPTPPYIAAAGAFLGQNVLYVLDQKTGKALWQGQESVVALKHVPLADAFFVFGANSLPIAPETRGYMSVRRFDRNAMPEAEWQEISRMQNVLLPRRPEDVAVLRNRIAYLVDGLASPQAFVTILNTQNPKNVTIVSPETWDVTPAPGDSLRGIVGVEVFGDGGIALVVYRRDLGGGMCQLALRRLDVGFSDTTLEATAKVFGPTYSCGSEAGWTVDRVDSQLVFAIPSTAGGRLIRYQPTTGVQLDERSFDINAGVSRLRVALMQCERIAVVANSGIAFTLTTVPLFGTSNRTLVSHPFGVLTIDPVNQRVLYGFRDATRSPTFLFEAAAVVGDCVGPKLKLPLVGQFVPPVYLEPSMVAVPSSEPLVCPTRCSLPEE